jgi:hypothetical protein
MHFALRYFPIPLAPYFLRLFDWVGLAVFPHPTNISQQQEPLLTRH